MDAFGPGKVRVLARSTGVPLFSLSNRSSLNFTYAFCFESSFTKIRFSTRRVSSHQGDRRHTVVCGLLRQRIEPTGEKFKDLQCADYSLEAQPIHCKRRTYQELHQRSVVGQFSRTEFIPFAFSEKTGERNKFRSTPDS